MRVQCKSCYKRSQPHHIPHSRLAKFIAAEFTACAPRSLWPDVKEGAKPLWPASSWRPSPLLPVTANIPPPPEKMVYTPHNSQRKSPQTLLNSRYTKKQRLAHHLHGLRKIQTQWNTAVSFASSLSSQSRKEQKTPHFFLTTGQKILSQKAGSLTACIKKHFSRIQIRTKKFHMPCNSWTGEMLTMQIHNYDFIWHNCSL